MEEELENPATATADIDSCCSTPYVSAPSSPGRDAPHEGFYYSAPASPMHFMLSATSLNSHHSSAAADANCPFEFDFSAADANVDSPESMTSADELFFNGQIRPMKLSTHLRRPQILAPLIESDDAEDDQTFSRGRDLKFRAGSLRRRTRSMSPIRGSPTADKANNLEEEKECSETTSSAGRSSKRWVFLKEFLYRSKSEGSRNEGNKFWSSLSFSPVIVKDKKKGEGKKTRVINGKTRSPHELHYNAKKAQAEEMRKKTFLPYRHGLFGCLGFSSKSYGAINGFARAFNTSTVSSR